MQLPDNVTTEAHAAIVQCLHVFAARGRAIREERERQEKENRPTMLGSGASDSPNANSTNILVEVCTDA
jgi:hypothetical protein